MKGQNVFAVGEELERPWESETIALVNDTVVRVVLYHGEYPEHRHDSDQWILVLEGEVDVEIEGEMHHLAKGDTLVVGRGRRHRVIAPTRSIVLSAWREGVNTVMLEG